MDTRKKKLEEFKAWWNDKLLKEIFDGPSEPHVYKDLCCLCGKYIEEGEEYVEAIVHSMTEQMREMEAEQEEMPF